MRTENYLIPAMATLLLANSTLPTKAQAVASFEVEQLAAQCASCHQVFFGKRARRASGVPDIRGRQVEEIVKELADFRSGAREHLIMKDIAVNLTEADIQALAEYSSKVTPN